MTDATGPYLLKPLIDDLPLSPQSAGDRVAITCVEFYGASLECSSCRSNRSRW